MDPAAVAVPVYVVVPRREHQMIDLVDVLAKIEPRFELRLVVAFDREGTWHPTGAPSCTRPCGSGCPKGFRCAREVAITSADQRGIRGDVTLWCGPIGVAIPASAQ